MGQAGIKMGGKMYCSLSMRGNVCCGDGRKDNCCLAIYYFMLYGSTHPG